MYTLYNNIVSDIFFYSDICVDFLGTHMISLVLFFRKPGVTRLHRWWITQSYRATVRQKSTTLQATVMHWHWPWRCIGIANHNIVEPLFCIEFRMLFYHAELWWNIYFPRLPTLHAWSWKYMCLASSLDSIGFLVLIYNFLWVPFYISAPTHAYTEGWMEIIYRGFVTKIICVVHIDD
jgi:hypothetical protein